MMRLKTTGVLCMLMIFFMTCAQNSHAQTNTITSSYGWTATITIMPKNVVTTTNCQWYYHYGVDYTVTVTFTGSTSNRGLNFNTYLACSGGTGNDPYTSSHYYSTNMTEDRSTGPNHRQYNAISSYNYGSNPSCTTITLAHANCTAVRLEYWGNGVTNGNITFPIGGGTALPIELLAFNAEPNGSQVDLTWSTGTERDNDYFTIEKTTDGLNYTTVATVAAAGNSTIQKDYTYTDYNPSAGISYYRLKQTDFNGESETFELKSVAIEKAIVSNVFPNPATDSKVNVLIAQTGSMVEVNLYNLLGKLISTQMVDATSGNATQILELPENGTYIVELMQNNELLARHKVLATSK